MSSQPTMSSCDAGSSSGLGVGGDSSKIDSVPCRTTKTSSSLINASSYTAIKSTKSTTTSRNNWSYSTSSSGASPMLIVLITTISFIFLHIYSYVVF